MNRKYPFALLMIATVILLGGCKKEKAEEPASWQTYVDTLSAQAPESPDTLAVDLTKLPIDSSAKKDTVAPDDPLPVKNKKKVYAHSEDGFVNIRSEASVKSDALGRLHVGDAGLDYLGTEGDWYKVSYKGGVGYVKNIYAQVTDGEAPATTTPATAASTTTTSKTTAPVAKSNTVYYVVIASFEDFNRARTTTNNLPDALLSPIYKVVDNGKVKYRICESCHSSYAKAKARINQLDNYYGKSDLWIWESKGLAQCAYLPKGLDGNMMKELTPQ